MLHGLNYINGLYRDGGDEPIHVMDPSSGLQIATHASADKKDVDDAVQAARLSHQNGEFSKIHPKERAAFLLRMGAYLRQNASAIAETISSEQGKPLFEASWEVDLSVRHFEYCSGVAEALEGKSIPCEDTRFDFTAYIPYGVSAQFIPAHYPLYIPSRSVAPALVTGNSCVLKTAELAPLTASWLVRASEAAGLPPGVLNIVCGRREIAGAALARHSDINHVVFVGNQTSASDVLASVAKASRSPSILEVGGTSPTIFFEDGDVEAFLKAARTGTYLNAGQFCTGMYRIIVHTSRYKEVIERAKELAESLTLGPGLESGDFNPFMGPLDSLEQVETVHARVSQAIELGARCVTGGRSIEGGGSFFAPTVLMDVNERMAVAQEEVFGPVMALMPFTDDADAIRLANGARHSGMSCSVFTSDIRRFMQSAKQIQAGHIISNASIIGQSEIPFGGFGRAGYGLLKGRDALLGYVKTKNILIPFA